MSQGTEEDKTEEYIRIRDSQDATSPHYDPKAVKVLMNRTTERLKIKVRAGTHIMNVKTGLRALSCNLCGKIKDGSCKCKPRIKVTTKKHRS